MSHKGHKGHKGKREEINLKYNELDILKDEASEALKLARRNGETKITLTRNEGGKPIEITENDGWEEIKYLGKKTECYAILQEKYPAVFEATDKQIAKAKEIDDFVQVNIGIKYDRMTLRDILNVSLAVFESAYDSKRNKIYCDECKNLPEGEVVAGHDHRG